MGSNKNKKTYYVADFENNVPKATYYEDGSVSESSQEDGDDFMDLFEEALPMWAHYGPDEMGTAELEFETRVWCAALLEIREDVTDEDVKLSSSIDMFMSDVQKLPGSPVIYFHNLGYDGTHLVTWMRTLGYEYVEATAEVPFPTLAAGQFTTVISDNAVWYSIKIKMRHGAKLVEFRDSLKLLPFSVDVIARSLHTRAQKLLGSIDYSKERPYGYQYDETEAAYVRNDVLVMAEALAKTEANAQQIGFSFLESLTIGGACMKEFYRSLAPAGDRQAATTGKDYYRTIFPVMDAETDAAIRKAYHGGYCYKDPRGEGKIIDLRDSETKGHTYDVNSLYPSVMYRHVYPAGYPQEFDPADFDRYEKMPYVIKVAVAFTIKDDHLPFIQIKGSRWHDNEYITDSEGILEMTFTKPDFELLQEQYNLEYLEILQGWWFTPIFNAFDTYIEKWSMIKKRAGDAGNKVERMIAKLMLNNLYGKMAQGLIRDSGRPVLDEDGVLRLEVIHGTSEGGYIPAGAFITAYARCVTIRAAQANFESFRYADTDSIHLLGEASGIAVGDELGEWAHEAEWDMARFVRQKTYIERVTATYKGADRIEQAPELDIKACGATAAVKTRLRYKVTEIDADGTPRFKHLQTNDRDEITSEKRDDLEVLERFTVGLVEAGKLRRKRVSGGTILEATTFRILG